MEQQLITPKSQCSNEQLLLHGLDFIAIAKYSDVSKNELTNYKIEIHKVIA
jgi:hypothetical protein